MSRKAQENVAAIVMLAFFVGVLVMAQDYGPRARLVPTIIAWFGLAMMVIQIVLQNTRAVDALEIDLLDVISAKSTGDDEALPEELRGGIEKALGKGGPEAARPSNRLVRELRATGIVAIAVGMFVVIGAIPTMLFFTFGYFLISGHFDLKRAALYSFAFAFSVYALFYLWLGVNISKSVFDLGFGLW